MVGDVAFKPGGDAPPTVPPLSRVCKLLMGPNGVASDPQKDHESANKVLPTGVEPEPTKLKDQKTSSGFLHDEASGHDTDDFHRGMTTWTEADVPEHPELLKIASANQEAGIVEKEGEEKAAEINHDPRCEARRSVVATLVTVGFWTIVFVFFSFMAGQTPEPDCSKDLEDLDICDECGPVGNVLPLFPVFEKSLDSGVCIVLYFVGLMWTFLGIGIICDQFMAAIEKITSAERVVWVQVREGAKHKFRKKVWNGTIANLSLMALGSSAPEIILNVVEIMGKNFMAGELGPSTIVGSAAFNLLVITAVCIGALPDDETRKIAEKAVFSITAGCSVFAYAWLVFILEISSKDRVDLWEALVTFGFFPTLLICAFIADKGWLNISMGDSESAQQQSLARQAVEEKYGPNLPPETVQLLLRKEDPPKTNTVSKAAIRKALMSGFLGGRKLLHASDNEGGQIHIGFEKSRYLVLECAGALELKVVASCAPGQVVTLRYITREGSAKENARYKRTKGDLTFRPFQLEQTISIPIIDNDVFELDECFYVQLFDLHVSSGPVRNRTSAAPGGRAYSSEIKLTNDLATVVVLNDDMPGTLSFDADEITVTRNNHKVSLGVNRTCGHASEISCRCYTVDDTAIGGKDYFAIEDYSITFADGEAYAEVEVHIIPEGRRATPESFRVILDMASIGVKFDKDTQGGEEMAVCEVILLPNETSALRRITAWFYNHDKFMVNCAEYAEQITSAFYCNGCAEDQSSASKGDWVCHCATLMFKVPFALVPPPCFCGGWLCFFLALVMIGAVTTIVGDMAALLGCSMGIPADITAITLVALGTSLPDTFASKVAAQQNPTADDSIGNVTGSNCVNVFLGLGLPWSIGAIYWHVTDKNDAWLTQRYKGKTYKELFNVRYPDGGFMVPAGSLVFSVAVFTLCAVLCIVLLVVRRYLYGGELGGPKLAKRRDALILVFLWLLYIVMSVLKSLGVL
eukprot:TRINITY_DN60783_c0_g1_i1.p1 TRINITY_DN60783_c0_g1~~TRINITY_DN60783_c0_g1_i1.p1  ORF type:complete len:1006 (-),score=166.38 TRINITY_DN60783_c0_g1_i1:139-3063(-)